MNNVKKLMLVVLCATSVGACTGNSSYRAPVDEVRLPGNHAAAVGGTKVGVPATATTPPAIPARAEATPLPATSPTLSKAELEPLPAMKQTSPGSAGTESGQGTNRAVVALLNEANRHTSAGQPALAAASLERALQIESENPWLWHRLAVSRRSLGELDLAVNLAGKSNSQASAKPRLQVENWRLIAEIRHSQGMTAEAARATDEAKLILTRIQ